MHASQLPNSQIGQSEVTTDDLAFIAQFADVEEETNVPPPTSAASLSVPVRHTFASISSSNHPHSTKGLSVIDEDNDLGSEDEIEHLLEGRAATIGSAPKVIRNTRERSTSDADIAHHDLSSEPSDSSSESDSTSDSDSEGLLSSINPSKPEGSSGITDEQRAKLSAELEILTSESQDRKLTLSEDEYDSDEDGPKKKASTNPISAFSTKHELENPPLPVVEIEELGEDERMEAMGSIMSVVGNTVIIQAFEHGSHRVLDTGSVLAFENRKVLGAVFEAFGPVMKPFYSVRFPSSADLLSHSDIVAGAKAFYVPGRSTFLFTSALRMIKGSDASNVYDEEVDSKELEFSDDEEERNHKKMIANSRKDRHNQNRGESDPSYYQRQLLAPTSDIFDGGIFYGDAYDDPQPQPSTSSSHPSTSTASIPATETGLSLDPRASRQLPSAYDEISPYDDLPPIRSPSSPTQSGLQSPQTTSSPSSRPTNTKGKGRMGQPRERPSRGGGTRGRGRGRGNPRNSESQRRPPHSASNSEDTHNRTDTVSDHMQRVMSPTSLAIARATGGPSWTDPQPFWMYNQHHEQGFDPQTSEGLGFLPEMGMGMGMDMGAQGQGFVAPHINPRFAAQAMNTMNMGLGMGMGGFDFQQQLNYQQQLWAQQGFYQQYQYQQPFDDSSSIQGGEGDRDEEGNRR